jgi:sterol desaturase/sphingolipid hydroxylase (fatty acid hydroxylase superfamily)
MRSNSFKQETGIAANRSAVRNSPGGKKVPGWIAALALGSTLLLLVWGEFRRPLRRHEVEPKLRRNARNLAVAGLAGLTLQLAERPVALRLTKLVEQRRWGLLKRVSLPVWLETSLAVVLMDYTFYVWHALNHKLPFLWRFHQPHHVDLGLDASTALRFHFGEMSTSVGWRAAQILLLGVSLFSLSVWQLFMLMEILFHHSNIELPIRLERLLSKLVVTPRMHGIHHSIVKAEQDSNWSSGFTIWDYLHGTLRLNVPHSEVVIGVPAYLDPTDTELLPVLKMPFTRQRSSWLLPNGEASNRPRLTARSSHLLG